MGDRFSSVIVRVVTMTILLFVRPADCQTPATPDVARKPYTLTIRAKQNTFKVGEEIRINILWKNTSDQPVSVAPVIPTAETSYKVFVEDEKGNLAAETKLGRRLRTGKDEAGQTTVSVFETAPIRSVQPGESLNEEVVLNKLYDLSKPGKYTVRVQSQSDLNGSAKSDPITITITDNQK
jgi:hypothetical protein